MCCRVKTLQEQPYSQKEAEAAVGLWTDNGRAGDEDMEVDEMDEQDAAAAIVD